MSIKLYAGNQYVTRGGWVTPPLNYNDHHSEDYPFYVGDHEKCGAGDNGHCSWDSQGHATPNGASNLLDLIAEYHEPAPAGWITDRKPTEADADDKGRVLAYDPDQGSVTAQWDAYGFDPGGEAPYLGFLPIPKFTPPPPEKKKVPLGRGDVALGDSLRRKAQPEMIFPIGAKTEQWVSAAHPLFTGGLKFWYWDEKELMEEHEISRDGGKTWENCWKEVAP